MAVWVQPGDVGARLRLWGPGQGPWRCGQGRVCAARGLWGRDQTVGAWLGTMGARPNRGGATRGAAKVVGARPRPKKCSQGMWGLVIGRKGAGRSRWCNDSLSISAEPQQYSNSQRLLANLIFTNGKCFCKQYLKVTADNDAVSYNANNYSQSGSTR